MGANVRQVIVFPCAGETLIGTLDAEAGSTGVLIVSGGNEIRIGAHRGMAALAQRFTAELGVAVFRYDRRGVGDSSGENAGFLGSAEDIAAAAAVFRREAGVSRVVAFGNCDAASALALFHREVGIDALVLANPWVIEQADDLPPAAAIRARYAERLRNPSEWLRLLRGGVNVAKVLKGLRKVASSQSDNGLAARVRGAIERANVPVTVLLAKGDNTAIAFAAACPDVAAVVCDTASHSFAGQADKDWLFTQIANSLH